MYELTYLEALFSTFLWLVMFFKYKPAMQLQNQSKGDYRFFLIAVMIFSVFGFISGGDFYGYYEGYESAYKIGRGHWEPFYNYLLEVLPYGYYYWRFVIWGLSSILLVLTFKRLNTPPFLSCFIFIIILIFYFPAPRNTLGYVALYYSITYIIKPAKNKSISCVIGAIGILISATLHKSMPLYTAILLCSFFPMKKWMYVASLCAFPILYKVFHEISLYVLNADIGGEQFQTVGTSYLERENFHEMGIGGYIRLLIERLPLILFLYYCITNILKHKITDKSTIVFTNNTYWLMYLSCLFFNQDTSSFLSPRFWDASLYPLALALPFAIFHKQDRIIRVGLYLIIISNILYKIMYPIYKI